MANIPGATNVLPGVFTDVITQSRGVSVPGGSRITAMIGEGSTDETLVSQAVGGGQDGLNPSYTGTTGRDGRHFQLSSFPLISNRTTLFKNGIPLRGLESTIDTNPFSNSFDYRIDITTGQIELQRAHLVDQGGSLWTALSTNVGLGSVNNLTLVDPNAQPENWTIRCIKVQRDALNNPIGGTASFLAFGSISGAKLDANGNPIVWIANNNVVSNGVISFSISETMVGPNAVSPFREGDGFLVVVDSGVLVRNDSLTANYIATANLNDPILLQGLGDVVTRHGLPSLTNNLSLGAQLAFANNAPALLTVQAAPALPRRTSYVLDQSVNALSPDQDDFIFPLPVGVVPDFNSEIHFFVKNNATNVETQLLPNKLTYYTLDTAGNPTTSSFIFDNTPAPGGYSYFYTVKEGLEAMSFGEDGYIGRNLAFFNQGEFSSASQVFDASYVGKALKIIDSVNSANIGVFRVTAVNNGKLYVVADGNTFPPSTLTASPTFLSDFVNESSVGFKVINPVTGLEVVGGSGTNGVIVTSGASTGTATLRSTTVAFTAISGITNYRLQINGSTISTDALPVGNDGLYDITSAATFSINAATNASPIAITTTANHNLTTGKTVTITGVVGNTAANGTFVITVTGLNSFTLNGSTGNGAYTSGGTVFPHVITIKKAIVNENNLEFIVQDPSANSNYIVLNKNIVPNGNGLRVTIVDARDATFFDAGWINALESLEAVECDILVPLPKQTISIIFQNALSHCLAMSNIRNKKERVLFIGAINGLTPDNLTGAQSAAVEDIGILEGIQGETVTDILSGNIEDLANYSVPNAFGNTFRAVYFYPDQIVVQAGTENVLIDGFYLAAAAAGYESADVRLENPLTNKVLSGFTILRNKQFSPQTLEALATAGVTTLQPVAGGGRVVWGITTTQSGFPEEQEISIVFIRDRVAKTLRAGFQGFIGLAETPNTGAILNTRGVILLNSLVSQGLITQYKDLSVQRDEVDPRQWNISVRVQPTYPVNFIYIRVSLGQL
jgi:hypothetical protein